LARLPIVICKLNQQEEEDSRRTKAERKARNGDKASGGAAAAAATGAPEPAWDVRALKLEVPSNLKAFLMKPVPQEAGTLLCTIRRNKSTFRKMFPSYRLYMKMPDGSDLFLMVSKKRSGQKTSNYLISMSEDDLQRKSPNYLGKLRVCDHKAYWQLQRKDSFRGRCGVYLLRATSWSSFLCFFFASRIYHFCCFFVFHCRYRYHLFLPHLSC